MLFTESSKMPRKHKVLTYRGNIRKAKKRRLNAEQRLQDSQQQDGGNQEQELNNSAIQDQEQQPAPQIQNELQADINNGEEHENRFIGRVFPPMIDPFTTGKMETECNFCNALHFATEKRICCHGGKVLLPPFKSHTQKIEGSC